MCANLLVFVIFTEKCMKIKNIGLRGVHPSPPPLDPPLRPSNLRYNPGVQRCFARFIKNGHFMINIYFLEFHGFIPALLTCSFCFCSFNITGVHIILFQYC